MKSWQRAVCAAALALCGWVHATTHVVAPGGSLADALAQAGDGDEIQLLAGEHRGQVGVITQKHLTLRGVGGRAVLIAAGRHAQGKAILVVQGGDVRIEDIEFRGARVPDGNGAGIRFERGHLVVKGCAFFDNQMGLLTANFADAELEVQDSVFGQARDGGDLPHLLYVGKIKRLTLSGSHFSGGHYGHLVKSRARENFISYNHLVDGPLGRASYELEFPNGGVAVVIGNVIAQSMSTENLTVLSFGAEGSDDRAQALHLAHNTFINPGPRPAVFVRVHELRLPHKVDQRLVNNLFLGLGVAEPLSQVLLQGNQFAPLHTLPGAGRGDYRLPADSPVLGLGTAPGVAGGRPMQPVAEFSAPVGTRPIAQRQRWSPGAYQE